MKTVLRLSLAMILGATLMMLAAPGCEETCESLDGVCVEDAVIRDNCPRGMEPISETGPRATDYCPVAEGEPNQVCCVPIPEEGTGN
ncbi:MAG: hypothetical protein D6795_16710 [Deltaproteobacteria bacterium]|nr:MAG: hypothetical protein D6795_16710 [Deltaproteobacteria bacterium]